MMTDTLRRWLTQLSDTLLSYRLLQVLEPLVDRYSSQSLMSAGLGIAGAGSPTVRTGASAWYGLVEGRLVMLAANTNMPALAGTVANGTYNVFCFFISGTGTLSTVMGKAGTTLGAVQWPPFPARTAWIGAVLIHPTGTGDFVGGTTPLDSATVIPNAVYINAIGAADPAVVIG